MIKVGFETTEPRTGTRTRVLQAAAETDGMDWVLEVTCPEGAPSSILEHVHTDWLETFEILEGAARYRLDEREAEASKGDVIVMVYQTNFGSEERLHNKELLLTG